MNASLDALTSLEAKISAGMTRDEYVDGTMETASIVRVFLYSEASKSYPTVAKHVANSLEAHLIAAVIWGGRDSRGSYACEAIGDNNWWFDAIRRFPTFAAVDNLDGSVFFDPKAQKSVEESVQALWIDGQHELANARIAAEE